jgi:hypothetical protein
VQAKQKKGVNVRCPPLGYRALVAILVLLAPTSPIIAQGVQSGTLSGVVRDSDGVVLPGATISAESSSMQGRRTGVTDANGVYIVRGLPPGSYVVRIELAGWAPVEMETSLGLGEERSLNVPLAVAGFGEPLSAPPVAPVLLTPRGGSNYKSAEIDSIPAARTVTGIAALAPGSREVGSDTGRLTISGAFVFDNVFMVDGVEINDNIQGTAHRLFIEDAIEETQLLASGLPAQYGRFSGGVIKAVTRSGGNAFSGTFRTSFSDPAWTAVSPYEQSKGIERESKQGRSYELTMGGPISHDRLWFFGAGRYEDSAEQAPLPQTGIPFTTTRENRRFELKLTGTLKPGHSLQGGYVDNTTNSVRPAFDFTIDPNAIESPRIPNNLMRVSYRGVFGSNAFLEAQYSRKHFGFRDAGGTSTDIFDSPFVTLYQQLGHYNAPYFDATDPEDRNNSQFSAALSYLLSTSDLGSHDIRAGVEEFTLTRTGGNSQSATGYVVNADYLVDSSGQPVMESGRLVPVFVPGDTMIEHWVAARETKLDIRTTSMYVQDRWIAGPRLAIDLGARFERVRSEATGASSGLRTNTLVPRLAATYDATGNGAFVLQSSYAHYSGRYNEWQFGDNSSVANPELLIGIYTGPPGHGRLFAPGFDPANYMMVYGSFPTANLFYDSGLTSPLTKELTISAAARAGRGGFVKIAYIRRAVGRFVEDFSDLTTGRTTVSRDGLEYGPFTNIVYRNSDLPQRRYQAVQLQSRHTLTGRWSVAAHWTIQLENQGNYELDGSERPVSSPIGDYPELFSEARHYPTGRLSDFQRHKVRAWTIYSLGLGGVGYVDVAWLYRYDSQLTYSLVAVKQPLTPTQYRLGAGYASLPSSQSIFFGARGSEQFDRAHLFDFSANYTIGVSRRVRPWVKLEVSNVFNNDKLIAWNTTVRQDPGSGRDELGLANEYFEGSLFGTATSNAHYPRARTFQFSLGFRF